ncbi:Bombesin receptor subtype-3 [Exaiptasia diaphana]|nr:Bombesin receptor subtype-3 [Exaiptasia diaphana]
MANYSNANFSNYIHYPFNIKNCSYEGTIGNRIGYALFLALGIFGNIFVIILALKYTVRKNLHHLIVNMAVSDALYLFMMILDAFPWIPDSNVGVIICKTLTFFQQVSYRVSLITLFVISIERFRATRQTLQRSRPYTLKQYVMIIGVSWLIPVIVAGCFTSTLRLRDRLFCYTITFEWKRDNHIGWALTVFDILTFLLCWVIFILSIITTRRLSRTQAIHAHLSEEQRKIRTQRSRTAVRMVLVSVLLYACCWIFNFFIKAAPLVYDSDVCQYAFLDVNASGYFVPVTFIYTFLPIVNSTLSPCIYIIFLHDFREAAKKVLCQKEISDKKRNRQWSQELHPMPNTEPAPGRRIPYKSGSLELHPMPKTEPAPGKRKPYKSGSLELHPMPNTEPEPERRSPYKSRSLELHPMPNKEPVPGRRKPDRRVSLEIHPMPNKEPVQGRRKPDRRVSLEIHPMANKEPVPGRRKPYRRVSLEIHPMANTEPVPGRSSHRRGSQELQPVPNKESVLPGKSPYSGCL